MNTETPRKPRIQPDGQIRPLTQLKLRPQEDRQWAYHLGETLCALKAIEEWGGYKAMAAAGWPMA